MFQEPKVSPNSSVPGASICEKGFRCSYGCCSFSVDLERLFDFPAIFNQKKNNLHTSCSIGKRFLANLSRFKLLPTGYPTFCCSLVARYWFTLSKSGTFLSFCAVFNTYCVGCRSYLLPDVRSAFLCAAVSLEVEAFHFCVPGIDVISSHGVSRTPWTIQPVLGSSCRPELGAKYSLATINGVEVGP